MENGSTVLIVFGSQLESIGLQFSLPASFSLLRDSAIAQGTAIEGVRPQTPTVPSQLPAMI